MEKKLLSIIACVFFLNTGLFAQSKPHQHDDIGCRTSEMMEALYKAHPESKIEAEKFNEFTKNFKTDSKASVAYVIPVVFHVFGTSFNGKTVTDAIIQDALQKTNEDLQGLTADWNDIITQFNGVKKALNITFKLAQIDPNGNLTTGITYHPAMSGFGNGSGFDSQIQQYAWDNYKYFNVYIQNDLYADGATNNSGVTWYPNVWMTQNNLARCVYNGAYLGSNTDENFRSVLTHEFGHYLNLIHPFEDGCPDAVSCSASGDLCCDTPPANDPNMNGALNCQGNVTNWQNFMDYTSNYAMFTINQVTRMKAALQHATRYPLWQAGNLAATGVDGSLRPRIVPSSSIFNESYLNDGSVSTSITLTAIDGTQFALTGDLIEGTHFNASNVPAGLSVRITISNATTAIISLTGNAVSHTIANNISNLGITFLDAAISGGISSLFSASTANLSVFFINPYTYVYNIITDIVASSNSTWTAFTLPGGDNFGAWYNAGKLRFETYTKPLVCEGTTLNISCLAINTPIGVTSNWVEGRAYPDEHVLWSSTYTSWSGKTAYIGFKIIKNDLPCYGWFKVVVNSDGSSYILTEYAYNEEPYVTIYAGSKTSGECDTQLPTPPTGLTATNVTQTGLLLNWIASTDNVDVIGYNVYMDGTSIGSSAATIFYVTGLTANTSYDFTVKAIDAQGNISDASVAYTVITSSLLGVSEENNTFTTNIFPNPANRKIVISIEDYKYAKAQLIRIDGTIAKEIVIVNSKGEFDVSNLPAGLYYIRISMNEKSIVKKVMISN